MADNANKPTNLYIQAPAPVSNTAITDPNSELSVLINCDNLSPKELDLDDGYKFLQDCLKIKPDMKKKYWNNLYGSLNQIFQYAIDKRIINDNPFRNMKPKKDLFAPPKVTRDCDTVFTKSEQIKVCEIAEADAIRKNNSSPLGIVLLFNLGLRDGELCAIKWGDIESNARRVYIHIQRELITHIDDNGKAEFCSPRGMDSRLRQYCKKAGMKVIKSPHDVRRTVLTNLYGAGMPLKSVQAFAGHSDLKQTMEYIRITDDDLDMTPYLNTLSDKNATNIIPFKQEVVLGL